MNARTIIESLRIKSVEAVKFTTPAEREAHGQTDAMAKSEGPGTPETHEPR